MINALYALVEKLELFCIEIKLFEILKMTTNYHKEIREIMIQY